jgi:hypothetical protein
MNTGRVRPVMYGSVDIEGAAAQDIASANREAVAKKL